MGIIIFGALVILIWFLISYGMEHRRKVIEEERKSRIYSKYGETEVAEKIIERKVWQGQTAEQLLDSWGKPIDVDQSVLKTKKKEIWKYNQKSVNRFGFKIKLENDVVVGWDEKL